MKYRDVLDDLFLKAKQSFSSKEFSFDNLLSLTNVSLDPNSLYTALLADARFLVNNFDDIKLKSFISETPEKISKLINGFDKSSSETGKSLSYETNDESDEADADDVSLNSING
ncbi:MAG: hypothetical protein LBB39_01125 [Mycoplasmataceae bacterium]|jgi:hypothetical protein|nr:hypothetical protein [Mycoplasmataceae bacterium]